MPEWLIDASAWVIPVILAITLHEAAHGFVALRFGDPTARDLGRVTFNPFKHVDRFGTIILPGLLLLASSPVLFGYAKPVPVSFHRLNPPRLGMFAVAIAGVTVNLVLAIISAFLLHIESWGITPEQAPWLFLTLYRMILLNVVLIVVNLIPVLPLDGGRVVDSLLPDHIRRMYRLVEPYGMVIVFGGFILSAVLGLGLGETVIGIPAYWLLEQILWLTGNTQG